MKTRPTLLGNAGLAIATALIAAVLPLQAAQEVYRWVDAQGVVHYTQVAPRDVPYERVAPDGAGAAPSFYNPRRARPSADSTAPPKSTPASSASAGEPALTPEQRQRRAALQAEARARLTEIAEARRRNCERAREQFEEFTTFARIRVADGQGGVRILSEAERAERITEAEEAIVINCEDAG